MHYYQWIYNLYFKPTDGKNTSKTPETHTKNLVCSHNELPSQRL